MIYSCTNASIITLTSVRQDDVGDLGREGEPANVVGVASFGYIDAVHVGVDPVGVPVPASWWLSW